MHIRSHAILSTLLFALLTACGGEAPPPPEPRTEADLPAARESVELHRELKTTITGLVEKDAELQKQQRDLAEVKTKLQGGSREATKLNRQLDELLKNNEKLMKEIKVMQDESLDLELRIQRSEHLLKQRKKAAEH